MKTESSKRYDKMEGNEMDILITETKIEETVARWILDDRIRIQELPREYRVLHPVFYIYAFRVSRGLHDVKRYVEDLNIIWSDSSGLKTMGEFENNPEDIHRGAYLRRRFCNELFTGKSEFEGDEHFEKFFKLQKERNQDFFEPRTRL
ncbi:hypothetical protein [Pseudolactococcus yaeyamensis]